MKTLLLFLLLSLVTVDLSARTWTSADGTTLEAELVSSTNTHVTIRRDSDGRRFTLPLEKLSGADQKWLADGAKDETETSGPNLPDHLAALIEKSGTLLFQDDFNREDPEGVEELGDNWSTNSASRAQGEKQNDLVDGTLVMTISPKADHAISTVHQTSEPFQDGILYVRMKLEDGGQLKLAFNDKSDKSVWAGHINGVTINATKLLIADEKSARFDMKYRENKESSAYKEALASAEKSESVEVELDEWHDVVTYHQGDTLTVYIDGEEVGSHTSPGFAHPTKQHFAFAVPKKAIVDDLHIWKIATETAAAPAPAR